LSGSTRNMLSASRPITSFVLWEIKLQMSTTNVFTSNFLTRSDFLYSCHTFQPVRVRERCYLYEALWSSDAQLHRTGGVWGGIIWGQG
jgi:hypothetical protein